MSVDASGLRARQGLLAALLVLAFFALQLPELFTLTRYHGDERFYTDAAIGMLQSGDLLTPRYPGGSVRFEKPLLSYLVLCGSYALFGISLFSSRLPFLLAGALLVWATWRAGLRLLRDPEAALLAAAMVAASPDFLALSARTTPDILLCLFLTLGLTGFALLLRGDQAPRVGAGLGWLGAGLAVAAKGGLGAVLVGYALAFAAASRERSARLRRLLHPVYTPLGLLIAAAGFGLYTFGHGGGGLQRALDDQVAGRALSGSHFFSRFLGYGVISFEHLMPWAALVVLGTVRDRGAISELARREPLLLRFALGWLLLLLVIFSLADVVRGRYLAPVYPLAAVVLAGVLTTLMRRGRAAGLLRGACVALLAIAALAGFVLALGGARIGVGLPVAGIACGAVAAAGIVLARRGGVGGPLLGLAITLLVAQTLGVGAIRAAFTRTPVPELAARLTSPGLASRRVAQIGESAHLASKLRVATGGGVPIDGFQRGVSEPDWGAYDVIVSDAPLPATLDALGFRLERCGETWGDDWTFAEVLEVVRAEDPAPVLAGRSQPYWLAVREKAPGG